MTVQELIDRLRSFPADAEVHIGISWPDFVSESYERILISDYGGGPQLNAGMDYRGLQIFVGCKFQPAKARPEHAIDLGQYETVEAAAKVHDFYVIHKRLKERLNYPDFDYENWIPPRMVSGQYNEHVAAILREKLMRD
jgi:hypothetical protein